MTTLNARKKDTMEDGTDILVESSVVVFKIVFKNKLCSKKNL